MIIQEPKGIGEVVPGGALKLVDDEGDVIRSYPSWTYLGAATQRAEHHTAAADTFVRRTKT